jgi:hypothetical protein
MKNERVTSTLLADLLSTTCGPPVQKHLHHVSMVGCTPIFKWLVVIVLEGYLFLYEYFEMSSGCYNRSYGPSNNIIV